MKKGDFRAGKGFTIIEVSLVLAIAGLIFLMVFVALPALRSSQRDTERKEAVTMVIDAIKKYQSNNRGALPTNWGDGTNGFRERYLSDKLTEPNNGERYTIRAVACGDGVATDAFCNEVTRDSGIYNSTFTAAQGTIVVVTRAKCGENNRAVATSNPRKVAVLIYLERGGVYCENS